MWLLQEAEFGRKQIDNHCSQSNNILIHSAYVALSPNASQCQLRFFFESSVQFKAQMPTDKDYFSIPNLTLRTSNVVLWVRILCVDKQTLVFNPAKIAWEVGKDVSVISYLFSVLAKTVIKLVLELPNEQ